MDEVFITVGKMFTFANGAERYDSDSLTKKSLPALKQVVETKDTVAIAPTNTKEINNIEYGSDESFDNVYNSKHST